MQESHISQALYEIDATINSHPIFKGGRVVCSINGSRLSFKDGVLHNDTSAAVVHIDGEEQYYINGKRYHPFKAGKRKIQYNIAKTMKRKGKTQRLSERTSLPYSPSTLQNIIKKCEMRWNDRLARKGKVIAASSIDAKTISWKPYATPWISSKSF